MKKHAKWLWVVWVLVLVVGVLGVWFATWRTPPDPTVEPAVRDVLARVDGRIVRIADLEAERRRRGPAATVLADEAVLAALIEREAMLSQAIERGFAELPDVRRQRDNLLIGALRQRELEPRLQGAVVAEEDVQAHYRDNLDSFTRPERRRLAWIWLPTPPATDSRHQLVRERIAELRQALLAVGENDSPTATFTTLAAKHSADQASRYRGGDIGWFEKGRRSVRPAPVVEAGFALSQVGDVSEPIEIGDGFALVMLSGLENAAPIPFENVRERIHANLLRERRREIEAVFVARTLAASTVERFPENLPPRNVPEPGAESLPDREMPPGLP